MTPGLDDIRPANVSIDLHRGHLDAAVATMPVPSAEVMARRLGAAAPALSTSAAG